jgi:hypothetical protein
VTPARQVGGKHASHREHHGGGGLVPPRGRPGGRPRGRRPCWDRVSAGRVVLVPRHPLWPQPSVPCATPRGALDTTFTACRADVPLESTPGVRGGSTARVLLSLHLPQTSRTRRAVCGHGNSPVTCAALMRWGRRARWEQGCCPTPAAREACPKRSRSRQDTRRSALAPAASWGWPSRLRRSRLTPRPRRRATVELRGCLKGPNWRTR